MQKVSDLFIQNIRNLPIWIKQVLAQEVMEELKLKLDEFYILIESNELLQNMVPKLSFKGKQEIQKKSLHLSDEHYIFLRDLLNEISIFEITIKNNWTFTDSVKIFCELIEQDLLQISNVSTNKNIAVAQFMAGKIKTGEFLKRIGKIDAVQLEQALRYQKELDGEGRHIKMTSILIKMGFVKSAGLDSLLLLKEEAKKRMPMSVGFVSMKYENPEEEQDQMVRLQKELARLENENAIMKKRLKKLLNINE